MKRNLTNVCLGLFLFTLLILIIGYQIAEHSYAETYSEKLSELKKICEDISPGMTEDIQLFEGNKSYTINKKKIYLCTKDKSGRYYHDNQLLFVLLHEFAHSKCKSIGHTEEFSQIFQKLLDEAQAKGYYNPSIPQVDNYCPD